MGRMLAKRMSSSHAADLALLLKIFFFFFLIINIIVVVIATAVVVNLTLTPISTRNFPALESRGSKLLFYATNVYLQYSLVLTKSLKSLSMQAQY